MIKAPFRENFYDVLFCTGANVKNVKQITAYFKLCLDCCSGTMHLMRITHIFFNASSLMFIISDGKMF